MKKAKRKVAYNALTVIKRFHPEVTNVVDAKKNINIWVVKKDIKLKGIKDHQNCAIAEACKRAFDATSAVIGTRSAYIVFNQLAIRFRVPENTSDEIKAFDKGKGFRTGTFMLRAPSKTEKLGGGYTGKTHNKSKRKRPSFKKQNLNVRTSLKTMKGVR